MWGLSGMLTGERGQTFEERGDTQCNSVVGGFHRFLAVEGKSTVFELATTFWGKLPIWKGRRYKHPREGGRKGFSQMRGFLFHTQARRFGGGTENICTIILRGRTTKEILLARGGVCIFQRETPISDKGHGQNICGDKMRKNYLRM